MPGWDEQLSNTFWSKRQVSSIIRDENVNDRIEAHQLNLEERNQLELQQKAKFASNYSKCLESKQGLPLSGPVIAENLKFWIQHLSWSFCPNCKHLTGQTLLPNYVSRPQLKLVKTCTCVKQVYISPTIDLIPDVLKGLTHNDIITLHPFSIHLGDYNRKQNGYRQKTNIFRLTWSKQNVLEKINAITDENVRTRCLNAYTFLMHNNHSSYRNFVEMRDLEIQTNDRFNVYDFTKNVGIECALWPNLYPTNDFCETSLSGQQNRASTKIGYMTKVFGAISDYATNFELLQFHYDLWLFKTVSGAVTTARKKKCSPARALEAKTFSTQFWKWQHLCLVDAVRQLGFPSFFLTISPSEWTFPLPPWLHALQQATGLFETQLPAFETLHFVHSLEQIVRGYLCGSNSSSWKSHMFSYQRKSSVNNVLNYFYRFEFQKRGTVHIHVLVWLKNIGQVDLKFIRADIPWVDLDSAYIVYSLQKSDKKSLSINTEHTTVESNNGRKTLRMYHPAEAFENNLRTYIAPLLSALHCRMDLQSSDGHGLLLKYVSSYVTKTHDAFHSDCLYTAHTLPYQAAFRHLKEMAPLEPEMWLSLSSKKIAWSPHRMKHFVVPLPDSASQNTMVIKYWARPKKYENYSLLQWLREFDGTKTPPKQYTKGFTFVATKCISVFKDNYFFQDMLLNVPHRTFNDLQIPNFETLPTNFRFFVCALHYNSKVWEDANAIKAYFELEGHKSWYISNIILHMQSLKDLYHLWAKRVVIFNEVVVPHTIDTPLDSKQQLILSLLQVMLEKRKEHFQNLDNAMLQNQSDDKNERDDNNSGNETNLQISQGSSQQCDLDIDWQKFLLIVGEPGTGKSYVLKRAIETFSSQDWKIFVATPTGYLATEYKDCFPDDIDSDTIHSSFQYPVSQHLKPTYNWNLSSYDIILLDELSMVPIKIFHHIVATISELPIRPIVLLAGDDRQLQPIEKVDEKIQTTKSVMPTKELANISRKIELTEQHRAIDPEYQKFLNHIRYWRPSQYLVDQLQKGKVLFSHVPTDDELLQTLLQYPNSTVITVSHKAANRINSVVLNSIMNKSTLLGYGDSDSDLGKIPIHKGMRVMITQNRNKEQSIVNGRVAKVVQMEGKTVILQLKNNSIVQVYPVSTPTANDKIKTTLPFMPAYALTIPKCQGQTLNECIVWLDCPTVAPGGAYVALSRCKLLENIHFMTALLSTQINPVTLSD